MTPNRLHPRFVLLALLAIGFVSTSCVFTGSGGASPESEDPAGSEASASTTGSAEDEVAYEPAYPEEVSSEGLTEEDTAQQEDTHSHGPDSHTHDNGHDENEEQHQH